MNSVMPVKNKIGRYKISADKSRMDIKVIHSFLSSSYWAKGRNLSVTKSTIRNSECFGLFCKGNQVGFARVISDKTTMAYLADVFILEEHRGKGLGKWFMEYVFAHRTFRKVKKWMLATHDAHGLYSKFGFTPLRNPQNMMEMRRQ